MSAERLRPGSDEPSEDDAFPPDLWKRLDPESRKVLIRLAEVWQSWNPAETPHRPVPLGGLWEGVELNETEITAARRDAWGSLGDAA
jgi:hypothetical protein